MLSWWCSNIFTSSPNGITDQSTNNEIWRINKICYVSIFFASCEKPTFETTNIDRDRLVKNVDHRKSIVKYLKNELKLKCPALSKNISLSFPRWNGISIQEITKNDLTCNINGLFLQMNVYQHLRVHLHQYLQTLWNMYITITENSFTVLYFTVIYADEMKRDHQSIWLASKCLVFIVTKLDKLLNNIKCYVSYVNIFSAAF